jgi:NAD(P)-dependent dehydrogenase (short-subunit alcohol dehydrogenase family)
MKTWFITGSSKGFGHIWAEAALARGDKVAATARNTDSLKDLALKYGDNVLPLQLDVTDKAQVEATVKQAHEKFGRLDVVVNNAGYGQFGAVEELSEQEARDQMETNLFGALWVTQAALPIMREQKSGHIIQVSSIGGLMTFPGIGMYHASKWALEGISQALAAEVKDFGIKVTIVEPTGYSTDWSGPSAKHAKELPAYEPLRQIRVGSAASRAATGFKRGDPEATAAAILKVVDSDNPPLRIFFGKGPLDMVKKEYVSRIAEWEKWNDVSEEAHGGEK